MFMTNLEDDDEIYKVMHRMIMQEFANDERSNSKIANFYGWSKDDIADLRKIWKMCKKADRLAFVYEFVALNDVLHIKKIPEESYSLGKAKDGAVCLFFRDDNWYVAYCDKGIYLEPLKFVNAIDACDGMIAVIFDEEDYDDAVDCFNRQRDMLPDDGLENVYWNEENDHE